MKFIDYLYDCFFDANPDVADDDLIDAFDGWLDSMTNDELIDHAEQYDVMMRTVNLN